MKSTQMFSLQPVLHGSMLKLRPLLTDDFDALYNVASDSLIWEQHPNPLRYQRQVFEQWFSDALTSKGAFVVLDKQTDQIIGSSRYYDWNEDKQDVAIGHTFLARAYWGGAANAELKKLMLDHALQWASTIWFHVGPKNFRSQRALQKIGAKFSHRGVKDFPGGFQEYVFYKIVSAK